MYYKSLAQAGLYLLLSCYCTTSIYADDKPTYSLSFSAQKKNDIPIKSEQTSFDCSNQIFTIIEGQNLNSQPIQSTLIWRNPENKIQEKTQLTLTTYQGKTKSWAWIKLHQSTGATLFSFIDPSAGMQQFIGKWEVELFVNNKSLAKSTFNVLC